MLIQYQNTFDEFVEASEALAARRAKKRRANAQAYTAVMVIFFLLAIWFYQSVLHVNQFLVLFHLFAPLALSFAVVAIVLCVTSVMSGTWPRVGLRTAMRLAIFLLILSPAFVMYHYLSVINPRAPRFIWQWTMLLPHTTWIFFVGWITIVTVKGQRNKQKKLWEELPSLSRSKTADISAAGIALSDPVSRTEMSWDGFVGWQETKSLFVLFASEYTSVFFPKAAFASDEEREAMRALMRFIPVSPARAFPVVQPDSGSSQPPPLPALNPAGKE
jgi:YcxB-like protein